MLVVGLDQAPVGIGYCYGEPGSTPTWGYHENPGYGNNTARLGKHVREWGVTFFKSIGAEKAYFEQVIVRKHGLHMPTLYKQFAVVSAIEAAAATVGLEDDCFQVLIADWRKVAYAGSRPTKGQDDESAAWKDMARIECARRGWLIEDHNVAEACLIWHFGCCHSDDRFRHRQQADVRRRQTAADDARRAGL